MAVWIVRKTFEGYIKKEVEKTKLTHELQEMVVHPKDRKYKDMVKNKHFQNFPITAHNITNSNYMFETDLSGAREKI